MAGFLGLVRLLPGGPAFFIAAVPLIVFPGAAIHYLAVRPGEGGYHRSWLVSLAAWFTMGLGCLLVLAFTAIQLSLRLSVLLWIAGSVYLLLIAAVAIVRWRRQPGENLVPCGRAPRRRFWPVLLLVLAVALSFSTLHTGRDNDDWFYLAYINDYLSDSPINSHDAFLGPERSAPARAWYGSWWVTEAVLAETSGTDPARCHQIYLYFLLIPMAVVALFTLARRIFGSSREAYLACFLQVIFYLSSAYPTDSAGWGLLSRISQDKSLAFFVPTMAATASGLGLLASRSRESPGSGRVAYLIYVGAVVAAALTHPLGLVWCAIGLVPMALVEVAGRRDRVSAKHLVLLLMPMLILGAVLSGPREEASGVLEERGSGGGRMARRETPFWDPYLPGEDFGFSSGDRIHRVPGAGAVVHPIQVTRFPLALLGLVLCLALAPGARRSFGIRYLVVLTGSVILLAFVPGVAWLSARLINERMLYRLAWLFPWGLIIAMFLVGLQFRLRWKWVIAVALALVLARGIPQNYFSTLFGWRLQARITPELEECYEALGTEPSPRGIVLASPVPSLMLPASVEEAYPAYVNPAYVTGGEENRIRSARRLTRLLSRSRPDEVLPVLRELNCRYVLLERNRPLANALRRPQPGFEKVFENNTYVLFTFSPVSSASPAVPPTMVSPTGAAGRSR
jgi:hypothetical protein